jgi:hypothetical protein
MIRRIAKPTKAELHVRFSNMVDERLENIAAEAAEPPTEDNMESFTPIEQGDAQA